MGKIINWLLGRKSRSNLQVSRDIQFIILELNSLASHMATIEEHLKALDDIVLKLVEQSGGDGWTLLVQNAIAHLDERIKNTETVALHCSKMFDQITGDEENKIYIFSAKPEEEEIQ